MDKDVLETLGAFVLAGGATFGGLFLLIRRLLKVPPRP